MLLKSNDTDREVIQFKSQNHLPSMIFCYLERFNSLGDGAGVMGGLYGKTGTVRISQHPLKKILKVMQTKTGK